MRELGARLGHELFDCLHLSSPITDRALDRILQAASPFLDLGVEIREAGFARLEDRPTALVDLGEARAERGLEPVDALHDLFERRQLLLRDPLQLRSGGVARALQFPHLYGGGGHCGFLEDAGLRRPRGHRGLLEHPGLRRTRGDQGVVETGTGPAGLLGRLRLRGLGRGGRGGRRLRIGRCRLRIGRRGRGGRLHVLSCRGVGESVAP